MVQEKKWVTDGNKQAEGYKEEDENSVAHVIQLEGNASFLISDFRRDLNIENVLLANYNLTPGKYPKEHFQ